MPDKYIEVKIYETTNYDQFILLPENRPISGNVVCNSIMKCNLLLDNPILVTPLLEVLDGQHRLDVARKLRISIHYKIALVTTREHIAILQNANQWRLGHHQHYHLVKKNPEYEFVAEIVEKHKLSLFFVIECCEGSAKASARYKDKDTDKEFKVNGDKELLAQKFQELSEVLNTLQSILDAFPEEGITIKPKFKKGTWAFLHSDGYVHKRMIHAIQTHPDKAKEMVMFNSEAVAYNKLGLLFKRWCPEKEKKQKSTQNSYLTK